MNVIIPEGVALGGDLSLWVSSLGMTAFGIVLFGRHELLRMGFLFDRAFFDTVCIDQSNEEKQREGIEAITAYLCHSDVLLVVFSEHYLQRIWTVFELVAYLAVKEEKRVVIQPVALAPLVVVCMFLMTLRPCADVGRFNLVFFGRTREPHFLAFAVIVLSLAVCQVIIIVLNLQRWGRARARLTEQVNTFSFSSAECFNEPDRREIMHAVRYLAVKAELLPKHCTVQEACEAMEQHARESVMPLMSSALSPAGIPGSAACALSLPVMASVLDDVGVSFLAGVADTPMGLWVTLMVHLLMVFNFVVAIGLVSVTSHRPQRGRCYEAVAMTLSVCVVILFYSVRAPLRLMLLGENAQRPSFVLGVSLVVLLQALAIWCLYGNGVRRLRKLRCKAGA